MAALRPILALVAVSLAATLGIAWGASLQQEAQLAQDVQAQNEANRSPTVGDPIFLTGLLVAAAVTAGLLLVAPPSPQRWGPAMVAFGSLYLLINLVQTAWPNFTSLTTNTDRAGQASINLIAFNGPGLPSVFVPIFGFLCAALLGLTWAARRLLRPEHRGDPSGLWRNAAPQLLRRWYSGFALLLPFLAVTAAGSVRLLVEFSGAPGLGAAVVLLALTALACIGLACVALWKAAQLAAVARNPRLAPVVQESWQGLTRAETGLAGALAAIAILGTFLPTNELAILRPGLTFGVTLRSHMAFLLLILVPMVPMMLLNRPITVAIQRRGLDPPARIARLPWMLAVACTTLAFVAAFSTSSGNTGALWGWIAAGLLATILAVAAGDRAGSTGACLLFAFAVWAAGNSYVAVFHATTGSNLDYSASGPGLLALARLAGALAGALPVWRLVQAMAAGERASTAIPLAAGAAAAAIGIALLEFPLSVWVLSSERGQSIAMGTMVAGQDTGAAWAMHIIAFLLITGLALAAARALRPEWFGRAPPWARGTPHGKPTA